jgi:hypothetical protein
LILNRGEQSVDAEKDSDEWRIETRKMDSSKIRSSSIETGKGGRPISRLMNEPGHSSLPELLPEPSTDPGQQQSDDPKQQQGE